MRYLFLIVPVLLGTCALDSATSAEPKLLWELETATNPQAIVPVNDGTILFVALKEGGVSVIEASDRSKILTTIRKSQLANLDAMNLFLHDEILYVSLGDFFAASGSKAGLAMIDVSAPKKPRLVSVWESEGTLEGAPVVVSDGRIAFLGAMKHGVIAIDVTNQRAPKHLATYQPDINFPHRNPNKVRHPNARGMTIHKGQLFVAYDAGGLRVIDFANPKKPSEVARYINETMFKKSQAYNNIVIDGKLAYIAVDYAGLEVVDISNPKKMRQVGWWNPWKAETHTNLWINSGGHANQLFLDKSRKKIYLSAGDSELMVIDVADPKRPTLDVTSGSSKNGIGAWGLGMSENAVFVAYIKTIIPFRGTWSGIKAFAK